MPEQRRRSVYKRILVFALSFFFIFFILVYLLADYIVVPILKDRLHTLIIQGSDSLYTYRLGKLKAHFFGGTVEVENLQVEVDSVRYEQMRENNGLPSLTMQLKLGKGQIKGVGILALLFDKRIAINEIASSDADIRITRHIRKRIEKQNSVPIWKAIRPKIASISIERIKLNGISMHYKNLDTSEAVKLQFDRFDADFRNIRIDSTAAIDTTRIGFTKEIEMKFRGLKFRTEDSLYKMKASEISYSSKKKTIEIDSFKLQSTVEKQPFYAKVGHQENIYYIEFNKVHFSNVRLDHFLYNNIIDADSIVFNAPDIDIYNDRSFPLDYASKIGKYPHQQLLKASSTILVKELVVHNGQVLYTEKNPVNQQEGTFTLSNMEINAKNITNDSEQIKINPVMTVHTTGSVLGSSALEAKFNFYLDSSNGAFEATGRINNLSASQLNKLAIPLGNIELRSLQLNDLQFDVKGEDNNAKGNVNMRYSDLAMIFRKTDKETGETKTKKFVTKIVNKFVLWPSNPGSDGHERISINKNVSRLTTQAFFGLIWKTIFAGMQDIVMKTGQ